MFKKPLLGETTLKDNEIETREQFGRTTALTKHKFETQPNRLKLSKHNKYVIKTIKLTVHKHETKTY